MEEQFVADIVFENSIKDTFKEVIKEYLNYDEVGVKVCRNFETNFNEFIPIKNIRTKPGYYFALKLVIWNTISNTLSKNLSEEFVRKFIVKLNDKL